MRRFCAEPQTPTPTPTPTPPLPSNPSYFNLVLTELVHVAQREGTYDEGVADVHGESVNVRQETEIYKVCDSCTVLHYPFPFLLPGGFPLFVPFTGGVSFGRAEAVLEALGRDSDMDGFYQTDNHTQSHTCTARRTRKRGTVFLLPPQASTHWYARTPLKT